MVIVNLEAYGFDSNCSKVYNYLLQNVGELSAKIICDNLVLSSKAVYAALRQLKSYDLIETLEEEYPKLFSVQNPTHALTQLAEGQIEKLKDEIRSINAELDKAQTTYLNQFIQGSCKRQISFYYFTHNSIEAEKFLSQHLSAAKTEILVNLVPTHILSKYIQILNQTVHNDIWVGVYLHENDLGVVRELETKIKAYTVEIANQQYVSVDNRIFSSGNILIDRKRFISIEYDPQGSEWILSSFLDFNVVEAIKNQIRKRAFQDAREILKTQQENHTNLTRISNFLAEKGVLSKQQLADHLQMSGKQLNESLAILEKNKTVQVRKISKGKGRPQEQISLVE